MERKDHCAVPACGEADDRAPTPVRNRAEVTVDVVHDVTRDRRLPVPPCPPVEVLGVGVTVAGALGCDDDRLAAARLQRARKEVSATIRTRGSRQPVQEVHDGISLAALGIAVRQIDSEPQPALDRGRIDRPLKLIRLTPNPGPHPGRKEHERHDDEKGDENAHPLTVAIFSIA